MMVFFFLFVFLHGNGVINGRKGRVTYGSAWHGHRHRNDGALGTHDGRKCIAIVVAQ